jgi:integrase
VVPAICSHRTAWCGLRFGELTELRRSDIDVKNGRIKIRRAVVHVDGKAIVGTPKSDAGIRDVAIPPHLLPILKAHITEHAEFGRDGLLFPAAGGRHLASSSLYGRAPSRTRAGWGFYNARSSAGRPDLRFHDLRHTGAVLAAATGATLAELTPVFHDTF